MTIMKLNHQIGKYKQSDINLWCPKNSFYVHLQTKFTTIARYPASKRKKNAITRKPLFRRKWDIKKLVLLEAINWQFFESLSLPL